MKLVDLYFFGVGDKYRTARSLNDAIDYCCQMIIIQVELKDGYVNILNKYGGGKLCIFYDDFKEEFLKKLTNLLHFKTRMFGHPPVDFIFVDDTKQQNSTSSGQKERTVS